MSVYNTRGSKHRYGRADYDYIYNRGYVWNEAFNTITKELISIRGEPIFSRHLQDYENQGNRDFSLEEITVQAMMNGEVVEIETELNEFGRDDDIEIIKKAVIRLPRRADGEQIVVVADFDRTRPFIKTAWLNKASDNHQHGLDTSEFEWNINGKYGYFNRYRTKAWEITAYGNVSRLK